MNIGIISAYTWTQFGNDYQPLFQNQYSSITGNIENTTISTIANGYSAENTKIPYQPLVANLGVTDTPYLILQNDNFLQIYDENLDLVTEIYTLNKTLGNIAVTDFDNNGVTNDIVGWYRTEINNMSFRAYKFESNSLSLIHEFNASFTNSSGVAGVRCQAGECYSIIYNIIPAGSNYSLSLIFNNDTGFLSNSIGTLMTSIPLEPLAKQDVNNDGVNDYLVFSKKNVFVINGATSGLLFELNSNYANIVGAKFMRALNSPYWQITILRDWEYPEGVTPCGSLYCCSKLETYKLIDSSNLWNKIVMACSTSGETPRSLGLAITDYTGDYYDDIFVSASRGATNSLSTFAVIKGSDGSVFAQKNYSFYLNNAYPDSQLVIGNLDYDTNKDMVIVADGKLYVFSPARDDFIYNITSIGGNNYRGCIIADLDFNSKNDIICSSPSWTKVWFSNYINQNAYITSVSFSPSTLIQTYENLYVFTNATDFESDYIWYSIKCGDDFNYSAEDGSDTKICVYSTAGVYNVTSRVRDGYHSTYNSFSYDISVTETGTICGNDVCETGENNVNCPADCPSEEEYGQANETGGMPIPLKLVDTENTEQGFLPEIYYGTLGFLSNTLSPMITLIFVIFFVLIILAIGFIIKKIAIRVGDLGR
jgi:hypothetical protein